MSLKYLSVLDQSGRMSQLVDKPALDLVNRNFTSYVPRFQNSITPSFSSGTNYQLYLDSTNLFVPDYEAVTMTITVSATIANAAAPILVQGLCGPRKFPLNLATATTQVTLNGQTFVTTLTDRFNILTEFDRTPEMDNIQLSGTCTQSDQYSCGSYGTPNGAIATNYIPQAGWIKNCFAPYFNSTYDMNGRLGSVEVLACDYTQKAVGAATAVVQMIVREPVFNDVWSLNGANQVGAYVGLTEVQIIRTFIPNYARRLFAVCPVNAVNVTNLDATAVINSASFYYTLATTDLPLPKVTVYKAYDYSRIAYSNQITAIAGGAVIPAQSPQQIVLKLDRKPLAVYIAPCELLDSQKTLQSPDTASWYWGQGSNLNVTFGSAGGQFSSFDSYQLYNELCARQGFSKSFIETRYTTISNGVAPGGGVPVDTVLPLFGQWLRIDANVLQTGDDTNIVAGSPFNSSINISITNLLYCNSTIGTLAPFASSPAPNLNVVVFAVNQYTYTISSDGTCVRNSGLINPAEVMEMQRGTPYALKAISGAGIFSNLRNKIADHIHHVIPLAKKAFEVGKAVHSHLKKGGAALEGGKHHKVHHKVHHRRGGSIMFEDDDQSGSDEE